MPTTFPFAAARETATNDGNPPPAADWISIVIVAGGLVALLFVIFLVRKNTGPRTQPPLTQATDDLEASRISSGADSRTSADRLTIQSLDQISPAKTYKDLKAEGTELPPDQTGPTVDCVICLETFENSKIVRCLPCHHIFHDECISNWLLRRHAACPLCLAQYIPESDLPAMPPRVQPYPDLFIALAASGVPVLEETLLRGHR